LHKISLQILILILGNNYEYDCIIIGGYHRNVANVSLYDTLGKQAVEFILQQIESKIAFIEDEKKLNLILDVQSSVETIVLLKSPEGELTNDKGIKVRVGKWYNW